MKTKSLLSVFASTLIAGSIYAADWYHPFNMGAPAEKTWSETVWAMGGYNLENPTYAEFIPGYKDDLLGIDTTDACVNFPGGINNKNFTLKVDFDVQLAKFGSEYGQHSVNMDMTNGLGDGQDSSITIVANDTSSQYYTFMEFGTSMNLSIDLAEVKFTGGTVNLKGLDATKQYGIIYIRNGNGQTPLTPSALTFTETNTLNSESDLHFQLTNSSSISAENLDTTLNLNGIVNVRKNTGTAESPNYTYYDAIIASCSNANALNNKVNIGGTINAQNFVQRKNTITNLTGTINVHGKNVNDDSHTNANAPFRIEGGTFNFEKGASINFVNGVDQTSKATLYMTGGSNLTIKEGATFNAPGRFQVQTGNVATSLTVEKDATFNCDYFRTGEGKFTLDLYGHMANTTNQFSYICGGNANNKSAFNIYAGATADLYCIQIVYSTDLNLYAGLAEGAIKVRSGYLNLDANGTTVNFYAKNALRGNDTWNAETNPTATKSTQKDIFIYNYVGTGFINFYADNDLNSFRFDTRTSAGNLRSSELTVYLDDDVSLINLKTLTNGTLINKESAEGDQLLWLVFDNFRNDLIHVDNTDNTVFEYVKSIDGEWVNFRLEADDTGVGGYWLTADSTVIPEPATYASILGALAIAFALMRRQTRK